LCDQPAADTLAAMNDRLKQILAAFIADVGLSTNNAANQDFYQRLADLTAEVIRLRDGVKSDDQPIPDLVTNLQAEIANLKLQLQASSQNERIIEDTRAALRQREEAPPTDQTAARLPAYAAKLMAELKQLRLLHGQHP